MRDFFNRIRHKIIELNLFKSGLNEVEIIQKERWTTRLYLFLLITAFVILVIYTSFGIQTIHIIVNNPSLETFETLQLQYIETLKCPCSQIAVKYKTFLQIQPTYHPICSSSFITQRWISTVFGANVSYIWPMDVRTVISAHAQLLRTFCVNTQRGISFVMLGINSSSLVSAEVLPVRLVQTQVDIQSKTVRSASKWQITVLVSFTQLFMKSNHLMIGLGTNSFVYIPSNDSKAASVGINSYQLNNNTPPCYCLSTNNCPVPGALYPSQQFSTFGQYNVETLSIGSVPVKGIEVGCYVLDSVLASTLECYYDPNCIELLVPNSEYFSPLQLTSFDRSSQNKTIQTLLDEVFVENWLINMSYVDYYHECAPKTCSYFFHQRNDFLIIFTTIIAVIGGLNTFLRFLVPIIIQMITFIQQTVKRQNDHIQRVTTVWVEQHSMLEKMKNALTLLWIKIRMLNLFDSNSNNPTINKLERRSTRIYIVLITIAAVILFSYTITTEETTVYTIQKPTKEIYEKFYAEYPDTIECTCSELSMPYSTFIKMRTNYHQVCTSPLISPLFFTQLAMIRQDIHLYPIDFMMMSTGHFQWLVTLCALSQLAFSNQLDAFQANLFVNDKLLPRDVFLIRTSQLADYFISDIQFYFSRSIKETLHTVGTTHAISATSTVTHKLAITVTPSGHQVRIEPVNYFHDCSCLFDSISCSDEAAFYSYNPTNNSFDPEFKIPGMRVACTPMQSLLESNLDCWYSAECYEVVIQYWKNRTSHPLDIPPMLSKILPSRFNSTTPVSVMVDKLMIENWSKALSYDLYYKKCAPLFCTYSITQRKDTLLIVTLLLGLLGGLNTALKLLIPLFIKSISWFIWHS